MVAVVRTDRRGARGRAAEDAACEHLTRAGYRIVERNVRVPTGEIDVVARHGGDLVFVEVRSRSSRRRGGPLETVGWDKQRRVARAAAMYLARRGGAPERVRFDVVGVDWVDGVPACTLVENAFDSPL